jgi:hypothetical protein
MNFDLFAPSISDADIEAFRKRGAGCLVTGSVFGDYALVPNETLKFRHKGGRSYYEVSYTPDEARHMLTLSIEEAQKVHKMKQAFGGHIKETGL